MTAPPGSHDLAAVLGAVESGRESPLVVLVHGVLDSSRSFAQVVELLEPEARLLRYDRRGYGTATGAAGTPTHVPGHVEDLERLLDGRHAVVVGHSFGGVVATGLAARAPDLVDAVVLYESALPWAPDWDDRVMRDVLGSADPEDAGLRLMLGDRWLQAPARVHPRLRAQAAAFVAEEGSTRRSRPPYDLAHVRAPLVYGWSAPFPVAPVAGLLRQHVDVELVELPGAGHMAHRDRPDAFADLVRRGLARTG